MAEERIFHSKFGKESRLGLPVWMSARQEGSKLGAFFNALFALLQISDLRGLNSLLEIGKRTPYLIHRFPKKDGVPVTEDGKVLRKMSSPLAFYILHEPCYIETEESWFVRNLNLVVEEISEEEHAFDCVPDISFVHSTEEQKRGIRPYPILLEGTVPREAFELLKEGEKLLVYYTPRQMAKSAFISCLSPQGRVTRVRSPGEPTFVSNILDGIGLIFGLRRKQLEDNVTFSNRIREFADVSNAPIHTKRTIQILLALKLGAKVWEPDEVTRDTIVVQDGTPLTQTNLVEEYLSPSAEGNKWYLTFEPLLPSVEVITEAGQKMMLRPEKEYADPSLFGKYFVRVKAYPPLTGIYLVDETKIKRAGKKLETGIKIKNFDELSPLERIEYLSLLSPLLPLWGEITLGKLRFFTKEEAKHAVTTIDSIFVF